MSPNIFRAGQFRTSETKVELPLRPNVSPARADEGDRKRLAIRSRIAREAVQKTSQAQKERADVLEAAHHEANEILVKARDQANLIVAGAKSQEDRLVAAAREKGLALARDEARKAAVTEVEASIKLFSDAAEDMRAQKENFLRSAAGGMIEIVTLILERILRGKIAIDDQLVARTIEAAITEVSSADKISLRIHPDDLEAARAAAGALTGEIEGLTDIALTSDPSITRGGVLIETAFGRIDARIEAQLAELLREIRVTVAR